MPRPKKSDLLLNKLNRSLDPAVKSDPSPDETTTPEPPATKTKRKKTVRKAAAKKTATKTPAKPKTKSAAKKKPAKTKLDTVEPTIATVETKRPLAQKTLRRHVPIAVGTGLIPLPFADLAALSGLQLKLLADLAKIYGVPFSKSESQTIVTSLLGSVGGTVVTTAAVGSLAKFVPGIGGLLSLTTLPAASGMFTWALGQTMIDHFEQGGTLTDFDLTVARNGFGRRFAEAKEAIKDF
jgi:uncharacterized protein (DUF697 family)